MISTAPDSFPALVTGWLVTSRCGELQYLLLGDDTNYAVVLGHLDDAQASRAAAVLRHEFDAEQLPITALGSALRTTACLVTSCPDHPDAPASGTCTRCLLFSEEATWELEWSREDDLRHGSASSFPVTLWSLR